MSEPNRPGYEHPYEPGRDWVTGKPGGLIRLIDDPDPAIVLLPGYAAIRIDPASRTIVVDGRRGLAVAEPPAAPEWTIRDLRDGTYGEFHRLTPAGACFDPGGCAGQGQHDEGYVPPAQVLSSLESQLGAYSRPLAPFGYFAEISFFGHIEHVGYVTETTGHGGIAAYHVDLPDKIWGANPLAEVEYAATAYFGKQLLSEESVREAWQADQASAERRRREREEWDRRAAERALAAGPDPDDSGDDGESDDPWSEDPHADPRDASAEPERNPA